MQKHKYACLLRGSGSMHPPEFRFSEIASYAIWDKFNTCDKTIITILNFKISGGGNCGLGGGHVEIPAPPANFLISVAKLELKQPVPVLKRTEC